MITIALICIICILYWISQNCCMGFDDPPLLSGGWRLIGHVPLLIGNSRTLWRGINKLAEEGNKLGGVFAARFGPRTVYFVTDPDDMVTISNTCLEKDELYCIMEPWMGNGLPLAKASTWKVHRKLISPAFSQIVLNSFMEVFNSQSRSLVRKMEKEAGKGPFDHFVYTKGNALESICLTALGVDFKDTVQFREYEEATERMLNLMVERFMKFWLHHPLTFYFSDLKRRQDKCTKMLHNLSDTILQKRKSEFYENFQRNNKSSLSTFKTKPFMDLLLELSIEKNVLTDKEIREHIDTIIIGGYDTTATTLMFTMLMLGAYPEVQDKVVAESKEIFGDEDRDVDKNDLSELVYLEAVIKETMRLYTPVPVTMRHIDKDVKLKNCTLSAGHTCFFFLFGVHRHPMWGPDRHQFRPDRWLDPSQMPQNPNAFAPFSVGKRTCIAQVYAMMSMKTTLAHLIRHYRITADVSKLKLKIDFVLKPVSGYFVSIEKRM